MIYSGSDKNYESVRDEMAQQEVDWREEKWRAKNFHILLSEAQIYFDQTRVDCGHKPQL